MEKYKLFYLTMLPQLLLQALLPAALLLVLLELLGVLYVTTAMLSLKKEKKFIAAAVDNLDVIHLIDLFLHVNMEIT